MRWHHLPDALDRRLEKYGHWHRWFAWHPVQIGTESVWLFTVWRRLIVAEPKEWREYYRRGYYYRHLEAWEHRLSISLDEMLGEDKILHATLNADNSVDYTTPTHNKERNLA